MHLGWIFSWSKSVLALWLGHLCMFGRSLALLLDHSYSHKALSDEALMKPLQEQDLFPTIMVCCIIQYVQSWDALTSVPSTFQDFHGSKDIM